MEAAATTRTKSPRLKKRALLYGGGECALIKIIKLAADRHSVR
jgi:hypothetical protein